MKKQTKGEFITLRSSIREKKLLSELGEKNGTNQADTLRCAIYLLAQKLGVQSNMPVGYIG